MNPIVKVNKIYPDAHIPTYGTEKAACADVYAYIPADQADLYDEHGNPIIYIRPHETRMIGTGLRFAPADGWATSDLPAVVLHLRRVWHLRTKLACWTRIIVASFYSFASITLI